MTRRRPLRLGLVAHVGDTLDALLVDKLGNLLLQHALVHRVGELGKHKLVATRLARLDMSLGTHGERAAASLIGVTNTVGTP